MTKMPLVNPGLTASQNWSKSYQNSIFHVFTSNLRLSDIFINFDLSLTPSCYWKPNFDSTIEMGWNQCHYKEYWIPSPKTSHGSKLELKRLRNLENHAWRISLLLEAITFDPTVWFSKGQVFWKLDISIFPVPPRSGQSKSEKASKSAVEVKTKKWKKPKLLISANGNRYGWHTLSVQRKSKSHKKKCRSPRPPRLLKKKEKKKRNFGQFWAFFWSCFLSLFS